MHRKVIRFNYFLGVFVLAVFLSSCSKEPVSIPAVGSPAVSETPLGPVVALTSTPFSPSATPVELAAQVNGEGIPLIDYQAELSRFDASSGTGLVTYGPEKVLEDMIDQILLAQGANQAGFFVTENILQDHINQFDIAEQDLQNWIIQYGYTEESFRRAMSWSIAAAWMRDQIVMAVPTTADQVHARQILLYNSTDANNILSQLNSGADFTTLAFQYDPATGGDLGWFPKGYLTEPALEDAAFRLDPGKYSDVIETPLGYHILFVIEHDPRHTLTSDARMSLQENVLSNWLVERRGQSELQILVP
jgi:peptidyl-prolyl cis-trans isomerase C